MSFSFFRCGGKAPMESDESPVHSCPMTRPSKHSSDSRTTIPSKVEYVDSSTSVPIDLYMSLMRAGEQARNSGQHYLIEEEAPKYLGKPSLSRKPTCKSQPRLRNSNSDASSEESPISLLIPTSAHQSPMKLNLGAGVTNARGIFDMHSSVCGA